MNQPNPLYTANNCQFAFQLYWGLSVFWRTPITVADWYDELACRVQPDGIRLLGHKFAKPGVSLFKMSTGPDTAPITIVERVKGRLQRLVRDRWPRAFRRNYAIRSFGPATRDAIEGYVASQLDHHTATDPRMQESLEALQIEQPDVDLSQPQHTSHGIYWYNLHVVLVHAERWCDTDIDRLTRVRDTILEVSQANSYLLSRGGILADHVHLTLGGPITASPAEIALNYLNGLAGVYEMKEVFQSGAYLGTFGEYDWNAVGRGE